MLGAANSLLAMVLDRRREFGLLRYLGAAPAQIRRMILLEAGIRRLAGQSARTGAGLCAFAVTDLRHQQAKFRLDHSVSSACRTAGRRAYAGLVATVLAGFYPARVASRLNPIEVIHEE